MARKSHWPAGVRPRRVRFGSATGSPPFSSANRDRSAFDGREARIVGFDIQAVAAGMHAHPVTTTDPPRAPVIRFRRPEPHRETPRMNLVLTYDATTDVAYLVMATTGPADVLGPTLLLENDPEFAGAVSADFTVADGRLVGLEFQRASACLPAALAGCGRAHRRRPPRPPVRAALRAPIADDPPPLYPAGDKDPLSDGRPVRPHGPARPRVAVRARCCRRRRARRGRAR